MTSTPFDDGFRRKNTQTFKLVNGDRSLKLALEFVDSSTRKKVQVVHVDYGDGKKTRWDDFKLLIELKLDYKIFGTRQAFIDKIYHESPVHIE